MNRLGLWRGLTCLMCFLLALSVLAGVLLERNADAVDAFLGTESSRAVQGEDGEIHMEPVLNAWRTAYYSAIGLSGVLAVGCGLLYVLALRRVLDSKGKSGGGDKS